MINKRLINTGEAAPAALDPLQNFETVTYTGNGGTQKITGYIRKGAAFNGSSSKIDLQLTTGLSGADPRSVSLWVNVPALPGVIYCFYSSGTNSDGQAFQFSVTSTGAISVSYYNRNINTTTTLSTNTWYHIVATYKGGDISTFSNTEIYINGSAQTLVAGGGSVTGTANIPDTNHSIGYAKLDNLYFLNGKIDQVRIFDKALSSGEVTTLYGETYASSTKSTTDIFNDGSGVALYELDEDALSSNFEQAAVFNGSSSRINYSSIFTGEEIRSYSFWFNTDSNNTGTVFISGGKLQFSIDPDATNSVIIYKWKNGQSQFITGTPNNLRQGVANPTINLNQWYHGVVIMSGTADDDFSFYLNGSSVALTYSDNYTAGYTNDGDWIGTNGRFQNVYYLNFSGKIDQVRIYSSELGSGDVTKLYKESADVPTANLVAHYKLDGNAEDVLDTYDGTASNVTYSAGVYGGTPTNVNFLGMAFQPDLVWIKNRIDSTNHVLHDSVRGTSSILYSDLTNVADVGSNFQSFDTNGFTVGGSNYYNGLNDGMVAWCWKAGGAAVSNTDGSITSQVSANQNAGFSIGIYSGNSTAGATIGHGLSSTPELIIVKLRSGIPPKAWTVYHKDLGNTDYLYLNSNSGANTYNFWNNTSPTDSVFSVSSDTNVNSSSGNYVFYAFHSVDGYQRISSYNGTSATNRIYTTDDGTSTGNGGFRPRFLLIKKYTGADDWIIYDSTRGEDLKLRPNTSDVESSLRDDLDFEDDGFTLYGSYGLSNASGQSYIYLAIA
jgi:hypothetical protein